MLGYAKQRRRYRDAFSCTRMLYLVSRSVPKLRMETQSSKTLKPTGKEGRVLYILHFPCHRRRVPPSWPQAMHRLLRRARLGRPKRRGHVYEDVGSHADSHVDSHPSRTTDHDPQRSSQSRRWRPWHHAPLQIRASSQRRAKYKHSCYPSRGAGAQAASYNTESKGCRESARWGASSGAPLREAKVVAHLFRETETMSRERGNPIAIVDNRPRQKDEGELEAGSSSNAEATWGTEGEARNGWWRKRVRTYWYSTVLVLCVVLDSTTVTTNNTPTVSREFSDP